MSSRRERRFQEFSEFLSDFVYHLNQMSSDGWSLLVEGKRDQNALRDLGYVGVIATVSLAMKGPEKSFMGSKKVVILTDLDREGGVLAARFVKRLTHDGIKTSLIERKRLKAASHGTFLHVENLSRFAETSRFRNRKQEFISTQFSPESKLS